MAPLCFMTQQIQPILQSLSNQFGQKLKLREPSVSWLTKVPSNLLKSAALVIKVTGLGRTECDGTSGVNVNCTACHWLP